MHGDAHAKAVLHGDDRQRNDRDGENRVRDQDGEVDRPDDPRAGEMGHDSVPQIVIEDVTGQKQQRRRAGSEHDAFVRGDAAALDQDEGDEQEDAAQRVQRRVEGGENVWQVHGGDSSRIT